MKLSRFTLIGCLAFCQGILGGQQENNPEITCEVDFKEVFSDINTAINSLPLQDKNNIQKAGLKLFNAQNQDAAKKAKNSIFQKLDSIGVSINNMEDLLTFYVESVEHTAQQEQNSFKRKVRIKTNKERENINNFESFLNNPGFNFSVHMDSEAIKGQAQCSLLMGALNVIQYLAPNVPNNLHPSLIEQIENSHDKKTCEKYFTRLSHYADLIGSIYGTYHWKHGFSWNYSLKGILGRHSQNSTPTNATLNNINLETVYEPEAGYIPIKVNGAVSKRSSIWGGVDANGSLQASISAAYVLNAQPEEPKFEILPPEITATVSTAIKVGESSLASTALQGKCSLFDAQITSETSITKHENKSINLTIPLTASNETEKNVSKITVTGEAPCNFEPKITFYFDQNGSNYPRMESAATVEGEFYPLSWNWQQPEIANENNDQNATNNEIPIREINPNQLSLTYPSTTNTAPDVAHPEQTANGNGVIIHDLGEEGNEE